MKPRLYQIQALLTRREYEVARLYVTGCRSSDIAKRLCVSEETLKCHLTHIRSKVKEIGETRPLRVCLLDPDGSFAEFSWPAERPA